MNQLTQLSDYASSLMHLFTCISRESISISELHRELERIQIPKLQTDLKAHFICFEGERGSGKDTLISLLIHNYRQQFVFIPRLSDNPAWQEMKILKKNMYFLTDNILAGIVLVGADLIYRLLQVQKFYPNNKPYILNRYIHSFVVINSSLLTHYNVCDRGSAFDLLFLITKPLPVDSLTFYLDASQEVLLERFWEKKKRNLTDAEKTIMKLNLSSFRKFVTYNYIKINTEQTLISAFDKITSILSQKGLI